MFFNCKNIYLKKTLNTNDVSGSKWVYHIAIQIDAHCWSKNATVWVSVTNHFAHIWLVIVHASCEVEFGNIAIAFHSAERVSFVQYGLILFLHTTAGFHICVKLIFAIFWCFLRSNMPSSLWRLNCSWIFPFLLFWMQRRVLLCFYPLISTRITCNLSEKDLASIISMCDALCFIVARCIVFAWDHSDHFEILLFVLLFPWI